MKKINCSITIITLLFVCVSQPLYAGDLLITNARLIDATGAPPQEGVSILIRDGLIAAFGDNATADDVHVLDVQGATVLPGLIDAHVHLFWGPGAFQYDFAPLFDEEGLLDVEYWRATYGKHILQYLRAYLACGVTTVLDAWTAGFIDALRDLLAAGNPGPRFLALAPVFTTPGGYMGGPFSVRSVEDVKGHFDYFEPFNTAGAKVFIESMMGHMPIIPADIRDAIRDESALRNVPLFIHATSEEDMGIALGMNPRAIMHTLLVNPPIEREKLSDDFITQMAATDTYQVTTMNIIGAELASFDRGSLKDPLLELVVPEEELRRAADPLIRLNAQWQSTSGAPGFARLMILLTKNKKTQTCRLEVAQDAVRRLHAAGVRIVAGSDVASGPSALYEFHGPSTLREVELIGQAGLTPMEAIQTATINAAEMLQLDDEIGTVEVGKKADLMIVRDDPLEDLANLKTILYTVQAGIAKTPEQWMQE